MLIHLTAQEAAAALLLITLGTDAYEGKEPDLEAIDQLNRLPGIHLRSLSRKLDQLTQTIEAKGNGL